MVSVCLPSDALSQRLPSYLGFSYLGRGVSLHGCSSKAQKCSGCDGPCRSVAERRYPSPEVRGGGREELPHIQGERLHGCRRAERSYSMFKVSRGGHEEIPLVQGKRNPSKTVGVARGHQRADTLKPYSQKTSQSNHIRTTALSNSMKLSHARGTTQDGRVMVKRSKGMANHFSILALRTP